MKPYHQSIVTIESRLSPTVGKAGKPSSVLPTVLVLSACAAMIGGVGYYVQSNLQEVGGYKASTQQTAPRTDRPAAIGHMIWESATRLIISAQQ